MSVVVPSAYVCVSVAVDSTADAAWMMLVVGAWLAVAVRMLEIVDCTTVSTDVVRMVVEGLAANVVVPDELEE